MPIKLVSGPAKEPVSVPEARAHLRLVDQVQVEDLLIAGWITAAREAAENVCRRAFITQTWQIVADRFPSPMAGKLNEFWLGQQWAAAGLGGVSSFMPTDRTGYGMVLPMAPLQSVTSIQYIDTTGATQTLDPSLYIVDTVSEPARIMPTYGQVWPNTQQRINAVTVTFKAGWGDDAASVPSSIKAWILLAVGAMYEHRESEIVAREKVQQMAFVDRLLDRYRVLSFV